MYMIEISDSKLDKMFEILSDTVGHGKSKKTKEE